MRRWKDFVVLEALSVFAALFAGSLLVVAPVLVAYARRSRQHVDVLSALGDELGESADWIDVRRLTDGYSTRWVLRWKRVAQRHELALCAWGRLRKRRTVYRVQVPACAPVQVTLTKAGDRFEDQLVHLGEPWEQIGPHGGSVRVGRREFAVDHEQLGRLNEWAQAGLAALSDAHGGCRVVLTPDPAEPLGRSVLTVSVPGLVTDARSLREILSVGRVTLRSLRKARRSGVALATPSGAY